MSFPLIEVHSQKLNILYFICFYFINSIILFRFSVPFLIPRPKIKQATKLMIKTRRDGMKSHAEADLVSITDVNAMEERSIIFLNHFLRFNNIFCWKRSSSAHAWGEAFKLSVVISMQVLY